jgi:hypothetical protein
MGTLVLVLIGVIAVIGFTNYPRRQPDTLAPIQLITLNGSAALVLLQIVNAVAATYWLNTAPQGPARHFAILCLLASVLSVITACGIWFHRLLRPRRAPSPEIDAWMRAEVDAFSQVVPGLRLYQGSAHGTEVEAIKTPDGAGIRIGGGLPQKLSNFKHHRSGGPLRVQALIRFMLLHELGHLLNGGSPRLSVRARHTACTALVRCASVRPQTITPDGRGPSGEWRACRNR